MRFRAVVFDFDGTLVQSADAKYQAFFTIFPDSDEYSAVIAEVLREDPDGSRNTVIPEMDRRIRERGLELANDTSVDDRIGAYGELAIDAVRRCPEMPGATSLLKRAAKTCAVFVCSNTPEDVLSDLVRARNWLGFIDGVCGYPNVKTNTVADIIRRLKIDQEELIVVGDGKSDEQAAHENGCSFFRVSLATDLYQVLPLLGGCMESGNDR